MLGVALVDIYTGPLQIMGNLKPWPTERSLFAVADPIHFKYQEINDRKTRPGPGNSSAIVQVIFGSCM